MRHTLAAIALLWPLVGCSSEDAAAPPETDSKYEAQVIDGMHRLLLDDIDALLGAAQALSEHAPVPAERGWDSQADRPALETMKKDWIRARSAYELAEGALAPLFPEIDRAIDARYDDFLTELGPNGDTNPFDGAGVTGMHAIERVLWADAIPARVVTFERTLPGYTPAAFPANLPEAQAFKTELCGRLVNDVTALRAQWQPVRVHIFIAFQGLVSLMNEQREKVRKAASDEEESRYSGRTMADLRDNLAGTRKAFAFFEPWLISKSHPGDASQDGPSIAHAIEAGFRTLEAAYAAISGDAMPAPPPTWSSENPSAADLASPFGRLFASVDAAVDPNRAESIVTQMQRAGALLGFAPKEQNP